MPAGDTAESVIAALRFALPNYDRPETFPTAPSPSQGGSRREGDARWAGGGIAGDRAGVPPARPWEDRARSGGMSQDMFRTLFGDPNATQPATAQPAAGAPMDSPLFGSPAEPPPTAVGRHQAREDEGLDERSGLWQIHNKYIISQIRSGVMIVDQHVAHERILYERALESMRAAMPMSQQLLFPLEMKVAPAEYALLREIRSDLLALGFDLSLDRGERVVILGVPTDVRAGQEGAILHELLDQYAEYQHMGMTDQRDLVAASFACRASIKAGDPLSEPEMLNLIEQLFATSMPYVCPHGRPIVIRIDLAELDRRFGRTS